MARRILATGLRWAMLASAVLIVAVAVLAGLPGGYVLVWSAYPPEGWARTLAALMFGSMVSAIFVSFALVFGVAWLEILNYILEDVDGPRLSAE